MLRLVSKKRDDAYSLLAFRSCLRMALVLGVDNGDQNGEIPGAQYQSELE